MSAPPIAKSYAWVPGAMLALPTILTLPGAVHAGIAFVNSLCSGPPVHACAWTIVALGGALYGVALGFALPVLVIASLSWAVLTVGNGRIARWFQTAPRGALVFAWLVILGIALPGSIVISMLGYLLPAALLR